MTGMIKTEVDDEWELDTLLVAALGAEPDAVL